MKERVLSIDTGIAITGWSVTEKNKELANKYNLIDYSAITTDSKLSDTERLRLLYNELVEIIEKHNPTEMAVESLFYFKNQKTVISVAQARGVILLAGANKGLPVYNYTPLQVKTAVTGYGRADKKQIQKMVQLIFKLREIPKPDDIADAIAISVCHWSSKNSYIN